MNVPFFVVVTLDYKALCLLLNKKNNEDFVLGGKGYGAEFCSFCDAIRVNIYMFAVITMENHWRPLQVLLFLKNWLAICAMDWNSLIFSLLLTDFVVVACRVIIFFLNCTTYRMFCCAKILMMLMSSSSVHTVLA